MMSNMKPTAWLTVLAVASLTTGTAAAQSFGGGSYTDREGHWEGYLGARLLLSGSADFSGGSSIDTDDDLGFNFGFGYNFSDHLLVSAEMGWNSVDYDGNLVSGDVPPAASRRISGDLETASLGANVTWHFLSGPLTPYVSGSLGWTWIDTNIATGPPQTGCWWDPWWGYICQPIYDTISDDSGSYGLGAGIRWDFNNGGFARFGYDERWFDIKNAEGTPDFGSFRLEFGGKF
jgi:opacity protein-like surface antigen